MLRDQLARLTMRRCLWPRRQALPSRRSDGSAFIHGRNRRDTIRTKIWSRAPPPPPASGIASQALGRERVHSRTESPRHYPDNDLVERAAAVAWLDPVPAYG